jgi:hypothetical protein
MKASQAAPNLRPFYLLLVGVGGIAAHLASEFAAIGPDARSLLFSPRHWYLGLAMIAGAIVFVLRGKALWHRASSVRDLKRMLHLGLRSLPLGGGGALFYALTAGLQFAVGMSTEFGEGAPIAGHDVAAGVLGALLVVLALSFVMKAVARTLPSIVEALVQILPSANTAAEASILKSRQASPLVRRPTFYPHLFNRPPPILQTVSVSY